MTQLFYQLANFSLGGSFSRLRIRPIDRRAKRTWSMGGARTNPELRNFNESNTLFGQLLTALRRRQIRQRWERDLRALDDRQLQDIGITRASAERTIKRIQFWI